MKIFVYIFLLIFSPSYAIGFDHDSSVLANQEQKIQTKYDPEKKQTAVVLPSMRIANDTDRYHSLDLSAFYTYSTELQSPPTHINLELKTVVKARKLNSDLYVVFVVDGKENHFSSNRSAIQKPVPGKRWVGERMVFNVPLESFRELASARQLVIRMGAVRFGIGEEQMGFLKLFADSINSIRRDGN